MGRDKASVLFRGRPLWQKQLATLRALDVEKVLVSGRSDPPWRPVEVDFVADAKPSRGPLSGLAAALSHAQSGHVVILAVDMPLMSAEYLGMLTRQIGPDCGVVPMIGNRAEPLAAIYPRVSRDEMLAALSGMDFSLQSLIRNLIAGGKLRPLSVADPERILFQNLNELRDLEAAAL